MENNILKWYPFEEGKSVLYDIKEINIVNANGLITNSTEADVINNIKNSVGILSDETLVAQHPWVDDPVAELERLKKQKELLKSNLKLQKNPKRRKSVRGEKMANKNVVPEAKEALNKFKMQAASEVGVNLKNGYNGDLTSRQAGSVGGQMVKKMIESYENSMK